jgi:hypothetical protein
MEAGAGKRRYDFFFPPASGEKSTAIFSPRRRREKKVQQFFLPSAGKGKSTAIFFVTIQLSKANTLTLDRLYHVNPYLSRFP